MPEPTMGGNMLPQNQALGTGEGESPLAAPLENIEVRTFASDAGSLTQSGGVPVPYSPAGSLPEQKKEQTITPPQFDLGMPFPPAPPPPQVPRPPVPAPQLSPAKKSSPKGLIMGLVAFILVAGIGAAGYFFAYPRFFSSGGGETPPPPPPEPVATSSEAIPPPPPPEGEVIIVPPAATGTFGEEPPITVPIPPIHTSLFKISPDLTTDVVLGSMTLEDIKNAVSFAKADVPIFKELLVKDASQSPIRFGALIGILAPGIFPDDPTSGFDEDVTVFSYTDTKGTWLGLAAKGTSEKTKVNAIETGGAVNNFFLSAPGNAATWKTGSVDGVSTRYLVFTADGASFNYGWLNDTLIISSSYAAFKEAVRRLR